MLTTILLWFSAIGCGLLGGLYFSYSTSIMTALGRIDQASGIAAMNAINAVIVRSLFMPIFIGSTLTCLALALIGVFHWDAPGAKAMVAGGAIYVLGMFVVTMAFNVPLNNGLASGGTPELWARYLRDWTNWNHVRTLASVAASALFICAISVR